MKSRLSVAAAALLALLLLSSSQAQDQDTTCKTTAKADLVLLVDGSWSIGLINFKTIRNFIARMVSVFDIGPDRVQIGLAQYSSEPKTEWHLNTHGTKASLLNAVANLPYKGGNTMTGLGLFYILKYNFKPNMGLREDARKIGVLITDGKSQDGITSQSQNLRDSGVELYAIGVKSIDENELRTIASDPDETHVYVVKDFQFLLDIMDNFTVNLCNSIKGRVPATNMSVYNETMSTMRVSWETAEGATGYMLLYRPINGTEPKDDKEVRVGPVNNVQLVQLTPNTAYNIRLYALHGESTSLPLEGTGVTWAGY